MRQHHSRRKAHQDVGTDPFEIGEDPVWAALDLIAEDFTWATAPAPGKRPKRHGYA